MPRPQRGHEAKRIMKRTKTTRTFIAILLATLALLSQAQDLQPGDPNVMVLPDSSNFVTASLLVIAPGNMMVSTMGHSAIRLECPAHHLDFCYTLESDPEYGKIPFLLGKCPTHEIAVNTEEFLKGYADEGRQVLQYELNLTPHEKQELWRLADLEFTDVRDRKFCYSYNGVDNCTSICLDLIERSLIDEKIVVDSVPPIMLEDNATYLRHASRHSSWLQFLLVSLAGTASDQTWDLRNRISPELVAPVLAASHFEGAQGARPVLKGVPREVIHGGAEVTPSTFTPSLFGVCLLALALLVTLIQRFWHGERIAFVFDACLFAIQVFVGVFLTVASCVGSIVGTHWNWYLIPFCPLAIVLWLVMRKHRRTLYLLFTIVLVAFLLMTPVSSQIDLPHQLITATFAVRTASNYFHARRG